jgi:F-type H+-transporting ATPase subunit beta
MATSTETYLGGDGLLGRAIDAAGTPQDGAGPLTGVQQVTLPQPQGASQPTQHWETGIKAIDCFAPIARGGSVALLAAPGVGMMVSITELIHRLATRQGGCAVFASLADETRTLAETLGALREGGIMAQTALVAGAYDAPAGLARQALAAAEDFCARGRHVLLVLDDGLALAETADLLRGRAHASTDGSLTTMLCFWRHAEAGMQLAPEATQLIGEADAQVVLSPELARQRIWPAVDPRASRSRLLDERLLGAEHLQTAERARALLGALDSTPGAAEEARARRILLFGSQPFFVAEPYTARPGVFVATGDALRGYAGLASGAYDELPEEELRFMGVIGR